MKTPCFLIVALMASVGPGLFAAKDSVVVSVRSQLDPDYRRAKLEDGSYKPETYVLVNGGAYPGTVRDSDIEKVPYPLLAGVVAQRLASKNYFFARKSAEADLMLVIHWGTTIPFSDGVSVDTMLSAAQALNNLELAKGPSQTLANAMLVGAAPPRIVPLPEEEAADAAMQRLIMDDRFRDSMNLRNARLLGYLDEMNARDDISRWAGAGSTYDDLKADIEDARYYIVIGAYDFQAAIKEKKKVLRWVTRISIAAQGNDFDERFAAMIDTAAKHFGQDSDGLKRRYLPEGRVDLGELKFIGAVADPKQPAESGR